MKKRDPDQPVGKLHVIPDFLPAPEELFPKKEGVKVTLVVDKESVDFFRKKAHQSGLKYQRMMREVLREYSHRYQQDGPAKRLSGRAVQRPHR